MQLQEEAVSSIGSTAASRFGSLHTHGVQKLADTLSSVEESLALIQNDHTEAEQRAAKLAEWIDWLRESLAEERRERQVEAAEERMRRMSESSELRDALGQLHVQVALLSGSSDSHNEHCSSKGLAALEEEPEDEKAPELSPVKEDEEKCVARGNLAPSFAPTSASSRWPVATDVERRDPVYMEARDELAPRLERLVTEEVPRAVAELRALLSMSEPSARYQEIMAESETAARSAAERAAAAATTSECLGVRFEALELHLRARLEALEEQCATQMDSFQATLDGLTTMPLEVQTLIRQDSANQRAEVRIEWQKALEEERERSSKQSRNLAGALVQEMEQSICTQIMAEVQCACREATAREVASFRDDVAQTLADASSLDGRVTSLEREQEFAATYRSSQPWSIGGSAVIAGNRCSGSGRVQECTGSEEEQRATGSASDPPQQFVHPSCALASDCVSSAGAIPPVLALQRFGESVKQLEGTIGGLKMIVQDLRVEFQDDVSMVRADVGELRQTITSIADGRVIELHQAQEVLQQRVDGLKVWLEDKTSNLMQKLRLDKSPDRKDPPRRASPSAKNSQLHGKMTASWPSSASSGRLVLSPSGSLRAPSPGGSSVAGSREGRQSAQAPNLSGSTVASRSNARSTSDNRERGQSHSPPSRSPQREASAPSVVASRQRRASPAR